LESVGVRPRGQGAAVDPRVAWRRLAENIHLFRGTPSAIWLNHVFSEVFGLDVQLEAQTADLYFDHINAALAAPAFRPRALFERFNIELLATTESPSDDLIHHRAMRDDGWLGRVVTAYRPDPVVNVEDDRFAASMERFATLSGQDVYHWSGYLEAHRIRRAAFREMGATSTDHGHPTAFTADLGAAEAEALFDRIVAGRASAQDAELFRGQMLTEMAKMSVEDGMVCNCIPARSVITTPTCSPGSGGTRAPTSPWPPNMSVRSSPC
jgi:glucuronate isomerase